MRTARYWALTVLLVAAMAYMLADMAGTVILAHRHRIGESLAIWELIGDGVLGYSLHAWQINRSDKRKLRRVTGE